MIIGLVLAGGSASRMGGGDKGRSEVGGAPILDRVITTLRPQCDAILISANGDATRFAPFDCPVVADESDARCGPLAGVLAGLDAVASRYPTARAVVTAPTDAPFLPTDLVIRLQAARDAVDAVNACARSGDRVHPTSALWSLDVRPDLRVALDSGVRRMQLYLARHALAYATWPTTPYDPFFNVNTLQDLSAAEAIWRERAG